MCGKGRAEPPPSEQQFGKLACQRAVLMVAIRRAKRAEENAEHLARLRQRVVQVGDSASEASRRKMRSILRGCARVVSFRKRKTGKNRRKRNEKEMDCSRNWNDYGSVPDGMQRKIIQ